MISGLVPPALVMLLRSLGLFPVCARHGAASAHATWFFNAGTLDLRLSLGQADGGLQPLGGAGFSLGRIGQDPFAISVSARLS